MRLEISQTQKQIISPVIMQTLELLTIPTVELTEKLEQEAEANPVLELEYPQDKKETVPSQSEDILEADEVEHTKDNFTDSSDTGYDTPSQKKSEFRDYDKQDFIENLSVEEINIYDHLMEQIHFMTLDAVEQEIAEIIVTSLDDTGFLTIDPEKLIVPGKFTLEQFEKMRQTIIKLDPLGIASRDLTEFLTIQIEERHGKRSIEYRIITRHIDLLEKKLYSKIARKMNVQFEDVVRAVENIKKLNISPAVNFSREAVKYIVPDAKVEVQENKIQVILNDEYIPNIKFNKYYLDIYTQAKDRETRGFLKENIDRAKILVENLKSRKEIIFKVILKIVEKQKDFFLKGVQYQMPLKLKDIADELSIHESTVSRAIKEKYIQTDRGIICLKQFFSTQVGNDDVSSKSIKEILKKIVEAEDKNSPLSDDKIVRLLKNRGMNLSRRTVAKYRAELNIQPAFMRRNPL
ncbi:MAG: RNA polymerase sigma-54 factor [Spirochaetes bacterium GWF1_51_8]|nr:MAG: RNA polymerase sigma-54 factor [Spirochaetes bacterium GWF1_51_8]